MSHSKQPRTRTRRIGPGLVLGALLLVSPVASAGPGKGSSAKGGKPGKGAGKGKRLVTFNEHVRPIFESHCTSCHDPDIEAGGLDLSNFDRVVAGGASGEVLAPGDADGSKL